MEETTLNIQNTSPNPIFAIGVVLIVLTIGGILLLTSASSRSEPALSSTELQASLPPVTDGIQYAKLTAIDSGYLEKKVILRKDVPAELTIFGQTNGCASSIVARDLWQGVRQVGKGQVDKVSFTPTKVGQFKGACAMGMYTFNIQVV